ncbi:MAG TPA: transcriptional repressor LexA [Candidatus Limnocylindria bacterium]|jgi:repressor LexA|nr:transcriptional repressor LexA [Candidatus Limnocylindria bacterium]
MTRHDAERKQKIIDCIARTVAERGYPPSVREIADAVGLASTSAVHHHLMALEREGLLERGLRSSRALRLTERGEAELEQGPRRMPSAMDRVTPFRMPVERDVLALPVLGEIAAGQPIEAYADGAESLDVPRSLEARDDSYVLRVRGKSMIDDLIDDGDYVVVQPQATARDGDIVVALLEDNGVTLKRFYREQDRIRLQPANAEMEPIYATDVQIQGKVVGVIRKLG